MCVCVWFLCLRAIFFFQLRTLQLELRSHSDHKAKELRKQNHIISVLQQEHKQLIDDIHILEGGTHAKRNVNVRKI